VVISPNAIKYSSPSLPLSTSASKQVSSVEKKDLAEEVEQTDIKDNILALFD
jgi:hypothetical protein